MLNFENVVCSRFDNFCDILKMSSAQDLTNFVKFRTSRLLNIWPILWHFELDVCSRLYRAVVCTLHTHSCLTYPCRQGYVAPRCIRSNRQEPSMNWGLMSRSISGTLVLCGRDKNMIRWNKKFKNNTWNEIKIKLNPPL